MSLTLRQCRLTVAQCAVLEQSLMYHDLEHKNIHYCDGTNLKDRLKGNKAPGSGDEELESGRIPVVGYAIVGLAICY